MDVGKKRAETRNNSVVAGSVWESRMKIDEVKGGIKVFTGEENSEEGSEGTGVQMNRKSKRTQTAGASGKRKTWKSENFEGFGRNPIQIAKGRSESQKNCDEQCKELSVSLDGGFKRSPIQARKMRSEGAKELSMSVDGIERSPTQQRKTRSESRKVFENGESVDGTERNSMQLRKAKSESNKVVADGFVEEIEKSPIGLRKAKSESNKAIDESSKSVDGCVGEIEKTPIGLRKEELESNNVVNVSNKCVEEIYKIPIESREVESESTEIINESDKGVDECVDGIEKSLIGLIKGKSESNKATDKSSKNVEESVNGIEKNPIEVGKSRSEEICKEFGVCQEKVISSSLGNVGEVKSASDLLVDDDDDGDEYIDEDEEVEEEEIEIEIEKKSFDIKEITVPEQKPKKVEISVPEQKLKKVVNEEKKLHQVQEKPIPISPIVNKQPPVVKHSTIHPNLKRPTSNLTKPTPNLNLTKPTPNLNLKKPTSNFTKPTPNLTKPTSSPNSYEFQRIPETQNKLQNLVDLVMWRDVSKSAFVFGIGTFIIVSSSYTNDLNVSLISVISYLGLVYLALIFLYRSIICRGVIDLDDSSQDYVVGEEEAIWILKLVLPYLNEFLLKLRALFCGDPATTMKLAVVLFALARCGSSITIWKMAKLGFFGVFTVPKVCSSYSTQLTGYGKFWVQRFRDAWESCSHKKAVAGAIFTLVWNLSSIVARIWAVFILFVAVRYYQQSMVSDDWVEDETGVEDSWHGQIGGQRPGRGPTIVEITKEKKGS